MRLYFLIFFLAFFISSTQVFGQCTIDVQPSSTSQSTCINIPFNNSISIQVSGSNLSYQWYSNNVASNSGGAQITGETSSSFSPPSDVVGAEYYYCVVSENNIFCVTSEVSGLFTVNPIFNAGSINTIGETICYNGNPAVIGSSTAASGGNGSITYKWQSSPDGTTWTDIALSNVATFNPPALTVTTHYRRLAFDGICNTTPTVSTGSWVVTVNPIFNVGSINTTGETICYNGNPAVIGSSTAASGGNGNITYKWQSSPDGTTWTDIALSNAATFDPPALTVTTHYRRLAFDGICNTTPTVSTGSWVVTVNPIFNAGSINTTGETICYNGNPAVIGSSTAASGGNGNITYKWQSSPDGTTWTDIALSNAATFDPPALTVTTHYRRLAFDGICNTTPTISTGSWVVTVNPIFNAGSINTTGETICYNGNPAVIGSSTAASGGNGNITYKWQSSPDGTTWTDIALSNAATFDPPALTVTTHYRRLAFDGICNTTPTVSTGSWVVTVNPIFNAGSINTTGETICYNGNPAVIGSSTAASGGNGNITYKWQSSPDGTTWTDIALSNVATFNPPALTVTTHYRRLAFDGICNTTPTVSTGSWVVTVNPIFNVGSINTTGETICYNGNPAVIGSSTAASGGNGSITYKWQSSPDGTTWTDIALSNAATFDPPALTVTTHYRRLAFDGICNTTPTVSTGSWVVTVNPIFNAGSINTTGETICYNGNPAVIGSSTAASGGNGNITYKWQSSPDGTTWTDIALSNAAAFDPPALTVTTHYRRLAFDGICNTTPTVSTGSWVVTVNPIFNVGSINTTGETICYNGNPAVIGSSTAASGGNGSITYKWQSSPDGTTWTDIALSNAATFDPPALTVTTHYRRLAFDGICNTTPTVSTGSWVVTVNPSATVDAGNYSPICAGESLSLSGFRGGSATSSIWSGGTGQFSNNSNLNCTYYPSPTEESLGSVSLILTTDDPDGPCPSVNDSVTITINNADFVTANNTDTISVCSGNETTLFGTGADFYIWSGGIQDSVPFVTQSSGWYEVTGYSSSTCFDNDFIYVHVLPSPEFALPSDTIVCSNVVFNLVDSYQNETVFWFWNGSSPIIPFTPNNSGYLNYESSLQNGCSKSDSIYVELIISPLPQITGDSILCSNASWLNYSVTNTGNQIEWQIVNGQIQGQEYNSIFVDFDSTNIASVIVIENVWGTTCQGSDTLSISLINGYALDPAQIHPIYNGSTVLYTTMDYPIMIWGFQPKSTNNETIIQNQSNQYCEFGNIDTVNYYYWVKIAENDSTCLTKSYYNSQVFTASMPTVNLEESFVSIYPNPANNELFVKNAGNEIIEFNLSDYTGRMLDQSTMNGLTTRGFDISTFETGTYFFNYRSGGSWKCMKFIKL